MDKVEARAEAERVLAELRGDDDRLLRLILIERLVTGGGFFRCIDGRLSRSGLCKGWRSGSQCQQAAGREQCARVHIDPPNLRPGNLPVTLPHDDRSRAIGKLSRSEGESSKCSHRTGVRAF